MKKQVVGWLWAAMLAMGLAGCTTTPPSEDQKLAAEVVHRLGNDALVGKQLISVEVHQGVVAIAGVIPDDAVRLRALGIVQGTPGVQRVEDHLRRP